MPIKREASLTERLFTPPTSAPSEDAGETRVEVEYFVVDSGLYPMAVSSEAEARSWAALPNFKAYSKTTIITRIPVREEN